MIETVLIILLVLLTSIFVIWNALFLLPSRQKKLNSIVSDLKKIDTNKDNQYAIQENIIFFVSLKSFVGYLWWGLHRRPRINASKLLEIADLPLPKWEKELYDDLTIVERRNFPGLSVPIRDLLLDEITKNNKQVILDLGCGSMEAERQVLVEMQKRGFDLCPVFIGVDSSPQAWDSLKEVFAAFSDHIQIKQITDASQIKTRVNKPTVLFYCGDALKAAKMFSGKYDLVFSSRFRHHLDANGKKELDAIYGETPHAVEYDDYGSGFSWLPPLLTAWNRPILLNGAVFSHIRQLTKKQVRHTKKHDKTLQTFIYNPPGAYVKVYKNELTWWGKE